MSRQTTVASLFAVFLLGVLPLYRSLNQQDIVRARQLELVDLQGNVTAVIEASGALGQITLRGKDDTMLLAPGSIEMRHGGRLSMSLRTSDAGSCQLALFAGGNIAFPACVIEVDRNGEGVTTLLKDGSGREFRAFETRNVALESK
jgi:hypothetical protein